MGIRLLVIGAGESALQLAAHVRAGGGDVTVLTTTPLERVASGSVRSTQVKVWRTREHERNLGLDLWPEAPQIQQLWCQVVNEGKVVADWRGRLSNPAVSVAQVDRFAAWHGVLADRGVRFKVETGRPVMATYVDELAQDYDLVVATAPSQDSDLTGLFPVHSAFPVTPPARQLAAVYLDDVEATVDDAVQMVLSLEAEFVLVPAYIVDRVTGQGRACHIVLVEARPRSKLDVFHTVREPQARADLVLDLLPEFAPTMASRCWRAKLADQRGTLVGAVSSVVREPVGMLPGSGRAVGCLGDLAVRMDPLAAQGANSASDGAAIYARHALVHSGPYDDQFLTACSDEWRMSRAYPALELTNMLLDPPGPVRELLVQAAAQQDLADRIAQVLEEPWNVGQLAAAIPSEEAAGR